MKASYFALVAILALLTLPATADVVTVTPVSEITPVGELAVGETQLSNGWSIVTNARGWAALSTFGPSCYQSRTGPFYAHYLDWYNDVWHPDTNFGRGAFSSTCDMWVGNGVLPSPEDPAYDWYRTPSSCWLGTNTWKGAPLSGRTLGSITNMDYYSFVDKCPQRGPAATELGWWAKPNWWNGPQQPIQLQLVVVNPAGDEIRPLWYRPWGGNYVGDDGLTEPGSQKGRWQWFKCLEARPGGEGKWYMPETGSTPNTIERGWLTWSEMLAFQLPDGPQPAFSEWKLAPDYTSSELYRIWKSPGWNAKTVPVGGITGTGTGYPLNLFVGARITSTKLFLQGTVSWYNHMYGERAQADMLTLGFSGEGTETYNFEPAPEDKSVRTVACTLKALKDGIWDRYQFSYPDHVGDLTLPYSNPAAKRNFLVKITGVVGDPPDNINQSFTIEDGCQLTYVDPGYDPAWNATVLPNPIRVFLPDDALTDYPDDPQRPGWRSAPLWLGAGDIVSVVGFVEGLRFPAGQEGLLDYLALWTNVNNITKHQNF